MDPFSTRVVACRVPFASEAARDAAASEAAAKEKAILESYIDPWVRISVEGFYYRRVFEDELKNELIKHFKSCGEVYKVVFPKEPLLDRRAFVTLVGHGAKEKALQLNGSDMGGWNAIVKFAPQEEDEEYQVELAYRESLFDELENDKRFMFGICVEGYDTSLDEDEVERSLRQHFSSCGEITHVYVWSEAKCTNIYFSKEEEEARALDLDGSQVDGFKITTAQVATTLRSNAPLAPGETYVGYSLPAQMLEFANEMQDEINFYMTEWRLNAMTKKLKALKKQKARALRDPKAKARTLIEIKARALKKVLWEPKAKALKKHKPGFKAWALRKLKARARRERGHSPFEKKRMLM